MKDTDAICFLCNGAGTLARCPKPPCHECGGTGVFRPSAVAPEVDALTGDYVRDAVSAFGIAPLSERDLQAAVRRALLAAGVLYREQVVLAPGSVVDLMIGPVAIELKMDGSAAAVTRQLHRYAESDLVRMLVLVTTRAKHVRVPETLNGKHVRTVLLRVGF